MFISSISKNMKMLAVVDGDGLDYQSRLSLSLPDVLRLWDNRRIVVITISISISTTACRF